MDAFYEESRGVLEMQRIVMQTEVFVVCDLRNDINAKKNLSFAKIWHAKITVNTMFVFICTFLSLQRAHEAMNVRLRLG